MSLHHYERNGNGYGTGIERLAQQYDRYAKMIAECPNPNIKLFLSEWNFQSIDWRTGLFAGNFLNMCEQKDIVGMASAALFIRRTDSPDWNNAFINFDYKDVFMAPNAQVSTLWRKYFSSYRLSHEGEKAGLNIATTMSENGHDVIVKIVNSGEEARSLTVKGNWEKLSGGEFEYYAPGDLYVENTMENKNAVALKTLDVNTESGTVTLDIEPLSAGVLVLHR